MSAELWVNDAGVAHQIREIWVNDAGVARRIQEIWVNDAGTARRVFVGDQIALPITGCSRVTSGTTATASYRLANTGDIETTLLGNGIADRGDWITPQINMANYECRATLLTGTFSAGAFNAWQSLATSRIWSIQATVGTGVQTASMTLEIRRASDAVVLASETITFSAESSA